VHIHGGADGIGEELKKPSLRDAGFDGEAPQEQDSAKGGQCEADPATRFSGAKTPYGGWNAGEKRNAHPHGPNHEGTFEFGCDCRRCRDPPLSIEARSRR
jgi:hypothetical protein